MAPGMSTVTLPRPGSDEAAPFYQGYIAEVASENIGEQLEGQLQKVERLFSNLEERAALARYAPGKWSVKEVLGHLTDVERIFSYRLLRIARGDATPLPGFDENSYVPAAEFDTRPLGDLLAEFRAVRRASLALLGGVPAQAWNIRGTASGNPITPRALAYILVGHVAHHLGVLRERYGVGMPGG